MSDLCNCELNEVYVRDNLRWNIADTYAEDEVRAFTSEDWKREARECIALWRTNGGPVRMSEEELAELFEEIYGVLV